MKKHLLYGKYVARHKWFVFCAGLRRGVPIRQLVVHDWHKLLSSEWTPYVNYFYGEKNQAAFDAAWLKHQHRGPHHWQHWVLRRDDGTLEPLAMPDRYRREMLADWDGAGRAITGKTDTANWYAANRDKMVLHPETRAWVDGHA